MQGSIPIFTESYGHFTGRLPECGSQNVCHGMPPILLKLCIIFLWTPLIDMKGAVHECPEGSGIFTGIIFREDVSLDLLYQSFWNVAQLLFRPFWRASAMFRTKNIRNFRYFLIIIILINRYMICISNIIVGTNT